MHCDACSTQVKQRGSEVPRYLVSGEKFAVLGFTVTHACCTGPAKQNGSAPVPGNGMSVAASSVLLTTSDSIFKVITVKKQIRMCNYKIFYGNYFDIHFQYRQNVYIIGKSRYGDIFSMTIPAISADWNIVKKRYTEYGRSLLEPTPIKSCQAFDSSLTLILEVFKSGHWWSPELLSSW